MKFRVALTVSLVLHLSLFIAIMVVPDMDSPNGTTYYVDLISLPGGGPGSGGTPAAAGGNDGATASPKPEESLTAPAEPEANPDTGGSMRDLTVKKTPDSSMRYPDKKSRNRWQPKEKPLVSVTRKKPGSRTTDLNKRPSGSGAPGVLSTRISGGGSGSGGGGGGGLGAGSFPYAYYVQTLRDRISGSWYRSLVSPGLRGSHVTTVYFRISRRGMVDRLEVEKSSGVSALDLSARRAVENAAPFPPLPDDFPYSHLVVHFEFEWVKK